MQATRTGILAISVGNTRTAVGAFSGREPDSVVTERNDSLGAIVEAAVAAADDLRTGGAPTVIVASVNPAFDKRLVESLRPRIGSPMRRVGADVDVPLAHTLGPAHTCGADRFLNALAAFDLVRQACVVVDAGTALTVDFVDGEGTFHGGAIAPGAQLMLRSLHERIAHLPEVALERPEEDPFPKTTRQAMLAGAFFGVRGAVRALAERFAEAYGAYPKVLATGGDARALFEGDDLVEHIVPDLTLRGIALAGFASLGETAGQDTDDVR